MITEKLAKTYNLNLNTRQHKELCAVLKAQCLATKNLTNTVLFLVKNLQSCHQYQVLTKENHKTTQYILKKDLHQNQIEILNFINQSIPLYNSYKKEFYDRKLKNSVGNTENIFPNNQIDTQSIKIKEFVEFSIYGSQITDKTYYQMLDKTFLQFLVEKYSKHQSQLQGLTCSDYEVCSSVMRQIAVHGVVDNYQNYYKSLKDYYKTPDKYKAKPQAPKYLPKTAGKTIEIPGVSIPANGHLVKIKSTTQLFTDYEKKQSLTKGQLKAYREFDLNILLNDIKKRKNICETEKPVLLRITAKSHKIKLEAVFNTNIHFEEDSILGKTITLAKENKLYKEKTNNLIEIKSKFLTALVKDKIFGNIENKEKFNMNIAGVDLGVTNIATIAYHSNNNAQQDCNNKNSKPIKGKIISAKNYEKQIKRFDLKLDNYKRSLSNNPVNALLEKTLKNKEQKLLLKDKLKQFDIEYKSSTLSISDLEELKDKVIKSFTIEPLNKVEIAFLYEYHKTIYQNEKYKNLLEQKNNFIKDYLHKITTAMCQDFINNDIHVVVIGKNEGWKQLTNMGKSQNRRFYNIPHAKLIQLLRYKCYEKGILLIITEESYTSRTSFVNNIELKEFSLEEKLKENFTYGGKRDKSNRHKYINILPNFVRYTKSSPIVQTDNLEQNKSKCIDSGYQPELYKLVHNNETMIVHADLNAAYNIIRKMIDIKYKKTQHSLKYEIYTMPGDKAQLSRLGALKYQISHKSKFMVASYHQSLKKPQTDNVCQVC